MTDLCSPLSAPDPDAQAAAWVVRQGAGPLPPADRAALDRWLAAAPTHRAAYAEARATWADLGGLARSSRPGRAWRGQGGRLALAAVVAGLLVCLSALWAGDPRPLLLADHRTAAGELREVRLEDGSRLELDGASAVAVAFSGHERRITLLAGTVYITAAPRAGAETRPLVVGAAGGWAQALGTQFQVSLHRDGARVMVAEHTVAVTAGGRSVAVQAGMAVDYADDGGLGAVHGVNPALASAWRRGRLVFDRVPLAEVVEVLGRHGRGPIVIADAALAGRVVSGVFDSADRPAALQAIARETGARVMSLPPVLTVLY